MSNIGLTGLDSKNIIIDEFPEILSLKSEGEITVQYGQPKETELISREDIRKAIHSKTDLAAYNNQPLIKLKEGFEGNNEPLKELVSELEKHLMKDSERN